MMEKKQSKDINKYIKSKKRSKKIRKNLMIITVILIASILFITKAPMFQIKEFEFNGTSQINSESLKEKLNSFIGNNIYTVNEEEIKNTLMDNKYIKEVSIKRKGNSKLIINIQEESPVFYITSGEKHLLINEKLEVVEEIQEMEGRNLVEVLGIETSNPKLGDKISEEITYSNILKKFYPYVSQNRETIKLDSIDISDIVNIKLIIGKVDVYFGDDSNIHEKMENIYRILLSEEIKLTSGYIDVSFEGPPVIKRNSN